ncbi:hypothetical protein B9S64_24030 [Streptomyces sp. SM18]|nr:hypothetical protein B9S64_24030 [Streptomyces sp. SM18]
MIDARRRGADDPQAKVELIEAAESSVNNGLNGSAENLATNRLPSAPSRFLDQLWDTLARILQILIGALSFQAQLIIIGRQEMLAIRALARLQLLASTI